jgi:excisionase family DNA binding protein
MPSDSQEPYVNQMAVAKSTGLNRDTIRRYARDKVIPSYRFTENGKRRYRLSEVHAALKARSRVIDIESANAAGHAAIERLRRARRR